MSTVRTRIAPSPTGFMHIGTLRTVMYDYFLARQQGGRLVVRIEDTDRARGVEDALESLLRTLKTLRIDYDEGPVLEDDGRISEKGEYGPYVQSKRLEIYRAHARQLHDAGHAYVCFCTPERLEEMRAAQLAAKETPKYDRRCLGLPRDEIAARVAAGEPHVLRMKVPEGTVAFDDAIRGRIAFDLANVDDQVILKADGYPTYHLAVVVDDRLMEISHVLRGEEWISSTPKQIVLHDMLGWTMPVYAHVPLILNPDRTKVSKRKGDVSVEHFLAKGYLPEALINFISTLGFNPKPDQEIYAREELVELFDLSKVNRSGAVMNIEKLDWMNHQYLMRLDEDALAAAVAPFAPGIDVTSPAMRRALRVERERTARLTEFAEKLAPYCVPPAYEASLLVWKKADAADAKVQLSGVRAHLGDMADERFGDAAVLESAIKEYIIANGLQSGNVLWPLRVALSGMEKSASPYELLWALGKEESIARIDAALAKLE